MSRFGLTPAFLSATLFTSAILCGQSEMMAPAAAVPKAGEPAAKTDRTADIMKRFDKNGDGKIDDDERADAQEMMLKERVDKQIKAIALTPGGPEGLRTRIMELFDKNKDGVLDAEERAVAEKAAEDRNASPQIAAARAEFLKRFDKNGNGKLEGDEGVEARKFVEERALPADVAQRADARAEELMKRFDKDGNGKLEGDERTAVTEFLVQTPIQASAIVARVEKRREFERTLRASLIKRGDKNSDGKIDDAEFKELAATLRPGFEMSALAFSPFDLDMDHQFGGEEWTTIEKSFRAWLDGKGAFGPILDPVAQHKRLDAVAAEVKRRRDIREGTGVPTPEEELLRLRAVSAEVTRRREAREQVTESMAKTEQPVGAKPTSAASATAELREMSLPAATAETSPATLSPERRKEVETEVSRRRAEREKRKAETDAKPAATEPAK